MFVIYLANIPVFQLHIPDVPDMLCVVADQRHIKGVRNDHRKILPVDCLKFLCSEQSHHLTPGSATICALIFAFSIS